MRFLLAFLISIVAFPLLLAARQCLPFIEAVGEDEAVARAEAVAEHGLCVGGLEASVVLRADA